MGEREDKVGSNPFRELADVMRKQARVPKDEGKKKSAVPKGKRFGPKVRKGSARGR
jgi:hypothetical protein